RGPERRAVARRARDPADVAAAASLSVGAARVRGRAGQTSARGRISELDPVTALHRKVAGELVTVLVKVGLRSTVVLCAEHMADTAEHGAVHHWIGDDREVEERISAV